MTSIYASVSENELQQRRQSLRRTRRIKALQAIWRSLFVTGLAGSLVWATMLSDWKIARPEQINIEGNQLLAAPTIRSLLPLSYPQSLLRVQPQLLASHLESQPAIAKATVTRQLLPPGLTIQVQERQPVAIAQVDPNPKTVTNTSSLGFLDAQGVWIPLDSYKGLQSSSLPALKVIGIPSRYRSYWPQAYETISHSPVKIWEIDWRNPVNSIAKTELGIVHLGADNSRLAEQLSVLDRMRSLPARINASQIAYIDLKNPQFPFVQMKETVRK